MTMIGMLTSVAVGVAVAGIFWWFWPEVLIPSPEAGERGRRRKEALGRIPWYGFIEPLVRAISMHLAAVPIDRLRPVLEKRLIEAGRPLGLNANELIAVSLLSAIGGLGVGGLACELMGRRTGAGVIVGAVVGIVFPLFKLDDIGRQRQLIICRNLSHAIDLAALSMKAGLDFPGALREVTSQLNADNPLRFEFGFLLQKLSLGWSRQAAVEAFGERIPTAPVRQFVGAITQAEKRGTPLAEVLTTQAMVLRTKRSQAAEQAAARAAVLIMGPLMLIFACVFIILLGPFIIKYIRGDII
jgi:tight adherence protein C